MSSVYILKSNHALLTVNGLCCF